VALGFCLQASAQASRLVMCGRVLFFWPSKPLLCFLAAVFCSLFVSTAARRTGYILFSLFSTTAQVTCATNALGLATTRMLLLSGFRVVMQDANVEALNEAVASLGDLARRDACYPICFDAMSASSVSAATLRITQDAWPVYILVLGGGPVSSGCVADTDLHAWKDSFATHVEPAFLLTRALLPTMRKRGWGRILTTCSLAGKTGGVSAGVAYSTAKGALQTLTFALARECAKDGITVNGIAPAYANSGGPMGAPDVVARLLEVIPVGRFLEPEEVAHTVLFLCHPLSSFITGQIIGMLREGECRCGAEGWGGCLCCWPRMCSPGLMSILCRRDRL